MSTAVYEQIIPGSDEASGGRRAELRRMWSLTWTLAITDWKLKFYGSALGALWTLVRPFAFFGVILFVFTEIAQLDQNVKHYSIYILFALVFFTFFAEVTNNSVQSLVARENLLRKMHFHPIVIPLSIAVTATLNLAMTFIAVLIFAFAAGVYPDVGWLELPVIILLLAMFAVGIGMLLSALYVRYRDMQPIWEVVSQMLFYASSVLYVATTVKESYRPVFLCNPLGINGHRPDGLARGHPHPDRHRDVRAGALVLHAREPARGREPLSGVLRTARRGVSR
jgi:ABC-2 type transport system permease protein